MWLLTLLRPFLGRILFYVGFASLLSGGFIWVKTHYYDEGWNAAIKEIAAEDRRAISAAEKARKLVKDCYDSGGEWNTVNGVCNRNPAGK